VGFVCFTEDIGKLYTKIFRKKFFFFVRVLLPRLFSFTVIKKIIQTLFYPQRGKKINLPDAELLSIAVAPEGQGKGIARRLIETGLEECRKRGIDKVKVLVADFNEPANKLYQRCGFVRVCQVDSHGVLSNIYVAALNP
jgi:ribosomal protein S18 acetylase RimI-like enzyme